MTGYYKRELFTSADYHLEIYIDYFNKRIRVDHCRGNMTKILQDIRRISEHDFCEKVIFYSRPEQWRELLSHGYELEGVIPGYFNGTDNLIMTTYKKNERRTSQQWLNEDQIIQGMRNKPFNTTDRLIPAQYSFRKAKAGDSTQLANLYGKVFEVYPTPMNDQKYVENMIIGGTYFYVVECQNEIVSAASADVNSVFHNAELTDCATLPDHRKYGLMKKLLSFLENDLRNKGIYCAYSLARALSFGMNSAFYQLGYHYNGRLTNNCYIFNKLEDMNVWVKDLSS